MLEGLPGLHAIVLESPHRTKPEALQILLQAAFKGPVTVFRRAWIKPDDGPLDESDVRGKPFCLVYDYLDPENLLAEMIQWAHGAGASPVYVLTVRGQICEACSRLIRDGIINRLFVTHSPESYRLGDRVSAL